MKLVYVEASTPVLPGNTKILSTDWELARDPNFSQLIFRNHRDEENLLWMSYQTNEFSNLNARCRFNTTAGSTDWMKARLGTYYVKVPTVTARKELVGTTEFLIMETSPFEVIGAQGVSHGLTTWFIYNPDNIRVLTTYVAAPSLTLSIPVVNLGQAGKYTIRAKHTSAEGKDSLVGETTFVI